MIHVVESATTPPDTVNGRIEHIASGRATRFASIAELVAFVREALSGEDGNAE